MARWRNHRDFRAREGAGAAGSEAENIGRGRAGRAHLRIRSLGSIWKLWEVRRGINQDLM